VPSKILEWLFEKQTSAESATSYAKIETSIRESSTHGFPFFFMLAISSIIATLGLLANSVAVIIGAMIIAPLMGPLIATSYWLSAGNIGMILRSLLTVLFGTILAVLVAFLITELIGWRLLGTEIASRLKPTLLDLGVALAAGAAAAFAYTRSAVTSALAGIAIAVALVPPLCTVGIALAMGEDVIPEIGLEVYAFEAQGPLLLYLANFIGIIFAGSIVFYSQYHKHSLRPLVIIALTLCILVTIIYPLGFRMQNLIIRNQIRRNLTVIGTSLLSEQTSVRIRNLHVWIDKKVIYVQVKLFAPQGVVTQEFINEIRVRLVEMIGRPVVLECGVVNEHVIHSRKSDLLPIDNNGLP
jgi:uncharacterized hydrophobic protein (TIGR00271 family)